MPQGLTPEWLTDALRVVGEIDGDVRVREVDARQVGDGTGMMSELALLHLTYSSESAATAALPRSLVAKYPSSNTNNREIAMAYKLYERETRFFAEVDALTSACSPRALISELQGDNFLILMEDMSDYRIGDQESGADLADTMAMGIELAKLHATFWQNVEALPWVPHISNSYHATNMETLVKVGWDNMTALFQDFIDPGLARKGDAFIAEVPRLQAAMDAAPITLLHGDFRMENVFFGTQPQHVPVAIIDWQGPLLGRGIVDLALMLGQSTRTAVRRGHERDVIATYSETLGELGVDYPRDEVWQDYRLALLYNWLYVGVVAGTLDASNKKAFAWMSQMVARQSAASLDLDVFELL